MKDLKGVLCNTKLQNFGGEEYFEKCLEDDDWLKYVKVVFLGLPSVGKTSIITLLSENRVVKSYDPTIGVDFGSLSIGECEISLWDFAGQERFRFLWDDFIRGAKVIFAVSDSTPKNVLQTRKIIDEIKQKTDAVIIGIANKQDLPGAMKPSQVEGILEVPTYGMVAIDPRRRVKMYSILRQALEQAVLAVANN
ncbi:MAG: GTP-binding protein [Candidatus Freyarchaeota archaeon]|nr:GTP-binding protein [Candidatus Jordarchaeia archaeon]